MISSPSSIRSVVATVRAPLEDVPPTGYESPHEARENGWLGQVPPAPTRVDDPPRTRPADVEYAAPGLAPDPWNEPDTLYPSDPTLFG